MAPAEPIRNSFTLEADLPSDLGNRPYGGIHALMRHCRRKNPLHLKKTPTPIMIAFAVVTLSTLTLAGFAVMLYALNHVVDGYEDEQGFHQGVDPTNRGSVCIAAYVEPAEEVGSGWVEGVQISG
jgi:hypothetical protein